MNLLSSIIFHFNLRKTKSKFGDFFINLLWENIFNIVFAYTVFGSDFLSSPTTRPLKKFIHKGALNRWKDRKISPFLRKDLLKTCSIRVCTKTSRACFKRKKSQVKTVESKVTAKKTCSQTKSSSRFTLLIPMCSSNLNTQNIKKCWRFPTELCATLGVWKTSLRGSNAHRSVYRSFTELWTKPVGLNFIKLKPARSNSKIKKPN